MTENRADDRADEHDRTVNNPGPGRTEPAGTGATARHAMTGTRVDPGEHRARRRFGGSGAATRKRAVGLLATVISVVTTVVVLILAVHILFVVFEANTGNDIVHWFGARADDLAWQFKDVFQPDNAKADVAVNYGLAALVYLVVGRVIVSAVRRAAA
ncbi:hypothetical protein [Actinomadura opuntiae]|uniref:hypothetical protein n=1 Tax=Actinomadura sp. OS1-43 TaxID=604315 RepID=UPI00255B2F5D|nr:hypothetical protein [Actinomadura sp. OS1-43]MDL4820465.1 hypothetical protein [Actinomadura sp. OS1-43]